MAAIIRAWSGIHNSIQKYEFPDKNLIE